MQKVLTSFMARTVAEGLMIAYTYSTMNDAGEFVERNAKKSFMVTDPEVQAHINAVSNYIRETKLK